MSEEGLYHHLDVLQRAGFIDGALRLTRAGYSFLEQSGAIEVLAQTGEGRKQRPAVPASLPNPCPMSIVGDLAEAQRLGLIE